MDRNDLGAILAVAIYGTAAAFGLVVLAFTAGVAAGLAVQGFEWVR